MKIDANIEFSEEKAKKLGQFFAQVTVDMDYVEPDEAAVNDWCLHELQSQFCEGFMFDDFKVTNMADILEDIAFEEFKAKTS